VGYITKLQVIERANDTRQFYVICPAPLAEAMELEKGEEIEWVVEDRDTLILRRPPRKAESRRAKHGR
jgi:bifunctional DNA-binding transcriptional regulator/antitoxin component of YhaV-PrlF toxin-antitoxin module